MADPRLEAYAKLLVERCVNVMPGWQVVVTSTHLARPILEEVARAVARRGAYFVPRIALEGINTAWAVEAPVHLLDEVPAITRFPYEQADAYIAIAAPENTRSETELPAERRSRLMKAQAPMMSKLRSLATPWVACQYPTHALAQDAGLSLRAFEEFLYGACLLDWDEEGRKMAHIKERFDRADQVRIVGEGTDLRLSLKERPGHVDDGHYNMPGGEVFYSPVEESVEGYVTFAEFPAVYSGHEVNGARLVFKGGKVVDASANTGEDFLLKVLDTDPGARVLGELGIGCNPGVHRHMKNTLYDEKIYGTIHLAVGNGFAHIGGKNVSAVHWDMVKSLKDGGKLYCDGEVVQKNGVWV